MRVIAGKYRSRRLRPPSGTETRPTSDRLRETLFNVLCAGNPDALEGSAWVDLYAGTGAVGIEALSRGAALVYFVDVSRAATTLIAANLASLGIESGFRIVTEDAARALPRLRAAEGLADYVFLDPPYTLRDEYARAFKALAEAKFLRPEGLVIVEHEKKFDPGKSFAEFSRYRELQQGDAALSFYRR